MTKSVDSIRLAHLSDPHFAYPTYSPKQFLSKRWTGNLNLLLNRRRRYQTGHLWHLPDLFSSLLVDCVFMTGDFSSTSLEEEFQEARRFLEAFNKKGLKVKFLPGNHDCYTKKDEKEKTFYRFFENSTLKEKKIECTQLAEGWWHIGIDCTLATPLFHAYGLFDTHIEAALEKQLASLPEQDRVILSCHFPLFTHHHPRRELKRAGALQSLLKRFPQVKLYLHGHDHKAYIVDRQHEGLPLVLNSGSCAHDPDGTLYLLDLSPHECFVQHLRYRKENNNFSWVMEEQKSYHLNHRAKWEIP